MELWFEALPSPATASRGRREHDAQRLGPAAGIGVSRIVVPEVLDGDHATMDNLSFSRAAAQATGLPVTAAIITAGRDATTLARRVAAADRAGADPLFVGPGSRQAPGVPVEQALRLHGRGRTAGVVTIPERRRWRVDEPQRLLRKQRAGADYALSQILFGARDALALRRAFLASLAPHETPLPVVYSLAPVRGPRDVSFLRRLGVQVPASVAGLHGPQQAAAAREAAVSAAAELAAVHADEGLGACGFCISHVMVGNVGAALELAACVRDAVRGQATLAPLHAS